MTCHEQKKGCLSFLLHLSRDTKIELLQDVISASIRGPSLLKQQQEDTRIHTLQSQTATVDKHVEEGS